MTFSEGLKKAFYFTVGAVVTGAEAIVDASDGLIKKGEDIVSKGKETFADVCGTAKEPTDSEKE